MHAPTFSIVTVVYNARATIQSCLESVRRQRVDYEHIVIDGASTDGTLSILRDYEAAGRIRLVSEPDDGIYAAMNKGMALCQGDIVGFLNADDFYASDDTLQRVLAPFRSSNTDSVYGDLAYVDSKDLSRMVRFWRSGSVRPGSFYFGWMPPHPTFFVRREVYSRHGGFRTDLGSAADYELILRFLFKHRISTHYVRETLIKMRTGGISNASIKNRLAANQMDRLAWRVNGLKPHPWTLTLKPLRKLGQFFVRTPTDAIRPSPEAT
jgi:glycosyltransferase